MSNATQTFRGTASLEAPSTPTIYNVTTGLAGVESSQLLNAGTKQISIRVRGNSTLQYAYAATESSTKFFTVPARSTRVVTDINFSGTLYFQTDKDSQDVEIEIWSP